MVWNTSDSELSALEEVISFIFFQLWAFRLFPRWSKKCGVWGILRTWQGSTATTSMPVSHDLQTVSFFLLFKNSLTPPLSLQKHNILSKTWPWGRGKSSPKFCVFLILAVPACKFQSRGCVYVCHFADICTQYIYIQIYIILYIYIFFIITFIYIVMITCVLLLCAHKKYAGDTNSPAAAQAAKGDTTALAASRVRCSCRWQWLITWGIESTIIRM